MRASAVRAAIPAPSAAGVPSSRQVPAVLGEVLPGGGASAPGSVPMAGAPGVQHLVGGSRAVARRERCGARAPRRISRAISPAHHTDSGPAPSPVQGCGRPSTTVSGSARTVSTGSARSTAVRSSTPRWNCVSERKRRGCKGAIRRGTSSAPSRLSIVATAGSSRNAVHRPLGGEVQGAHRLAVGRIAEAGEEEKNQKVGEAPTTYRVSSTYQRPSSTSAGAQKATQQAAEDLAPTRP